MGMPKFSSRGKDMLVPLKELQSIVGNKIKFPEKK
jgi:hypothetical protein